MGEKTRREFKLVLKGDSDTLDSTEELLREVLESAKDEDVKSTFSMSSEDEIEVEEDEEDEEAEDGDGDDLEEDDE